MRGEAKREPKPGGYWEDWDNVRSELENEIRLNKGRFPSRSRLRKRGKSLLEKASYKHREKVKELRKELCCEKTFKDKGYWKIFENVEEELTKLIKKLGDFPTTGEIKKFGPFSLIGAISQYHGGVEEVRLRLGYPNKRDRPSYWNKKTIYAEIDEVINQLGHFPTLEELKSIGKGGLESAIRRHKISITDIIKEKGYTLKKRPKNYWKNWANLESELKKLISEIGYLPSHRKLILVGKSNLSHGIKIHGGFRKVRKRLNEKMPSKDRFYWQSMDNTIYELQKVIKKLEHFPTQRELNKEGLSSLYVSATKYHGGMGYLREKMGYNEQMRIKLVKELEEIVDRMVA